MNRPDYIDQDKVKAAIEEIAVLMCVYRHNFSLYRLFLLSNLRLSLQGLLNDLP